MQALAGQNIIRIAAVALGLSTLSFAAGVAGDLSIIEPARSGQRVVLRIPPEIPSDAPRARPLVSTSSAEAAPRWRVRHVEAVEVRPLIQAVQTAHEEAFEFVPAVMEIAPSAVKPQLDAQVKPAPEALLEPYELKAA